MISILLPYCSIIWLILMVVEDLRHRYVQAIRYAVMTLMAALIMIGIELAHHNFDHLLVFGAVIAAAIVQLVICRMYVRQIFQATLGREP